MMMPALASPYSPASGVATPTLHPAAMPQIDAAYAAAAAANLQPPAKDTTWTKLFVGGLPYTTTDQELREFFEEFGEIEEAAVIIDRQTGKSKGYGFVTMADTKAAARAVQNPNPVIQGRKSNVNYAFIGAKQQHFGGGVHTRGASTASVPAVSTVPEDYSLYGAMMASDPYSAAATAASFRYLSYLPAQYGAKGALRTKIMRSPPGTTMAHRPITGPYRVGAAPTAAGTLMYQSPYGSVMSAMQVPTQPAATQGQQQMIAGAGAYQSPSAYEYSLAAAATSAAAPMAAHYAIYPQLFEQQQYMALQAGAHTMSTAGAQQGTMLSSMYQSMGPSSAAAVSAAVTSATPALPVQATPAALPAPPSYPTIQEQR